MRKKTIRRLPENARKLAKLRNELSSILLRLTRLIPQIAEAETELKGYRKAQEHYKNRTKGEVNPEDLGMWDVQILSKVTKEKDNGTRST